MKIIAAEGFPSDSESKESACNAGSTLKMKVQSLSRIRLSATQCTVAHQASMSMGFSRQEYWTGLPFPSSGGLPNPGIQVGSPTLRADSLLSTRESWHYVLGNILGWPKSLFRFFHHILWKNLKELLDQIYIYIYIKPINYLIFIAYNI